MAKRRVGRLFVSAVGERRLERAAAWLAERGRAEPLSIIAPSRLAADELVRRAALGAGALFGWQRLTLGRLATTLAEPELGARRLTPVGAFGLEALTTRVVHDLAARGALGRFAEVAAWPGLARAMTRTLVELRLAGLAPEALPAGCADLARIQAAFDAELNASRLADRASVLRLAAELAGDGAARHALLDVPALFLDLPVTAGLERDLLRALAARAPALLATAPAGDERSLALLAGFLEREPLPVPQPEAAGPTSSLARLQARLFVEGEAQEAELGDDVVILSAPGESRECVEIARRVRAEAARGVPFDRMAIFLRSPAQYRSHLEEALRRAGVPVCFVHGTRRPDPAGRAFLALLACASEGLSAHRFAEYLSLGEVPDADAAGGPPAAESAAERWAPPSEELLPEGLARRSEPGPEAQAAAAAEEEAAPPSARDEEPVAAGTLRAPRRWEALLVDAAVIGGRERWQRRLAGLASEFASQLEALDDRDDPRGELIRRQLADLASLRAFALPLLELLDSLPERASWGEWIERLGELAARAIRRPERLLALLGELAPMAAIGAVDLREVRLVLGKRLSDLVVPPAPRAGRLLVGPAELARGMSFETVFVPGLAERLFPQKLVEDPILRDADRRFAGGELVTNDDRIAEERLALRLPVGSARRRVILSWPRLDVEQSRPRVPSFYGLEVLRAAEGRLPGFEELAGRAEKGGAARIGWPAPSSPADAIDEAEHDLALLDELFRLPEEETLGTARYLLDANPHLARALRFRARRWIKKWTSADGLVEPGELGREALAAHALEARSYSPTALQNFAICPYRFVLYALHKLSPRQEPVAIEELDPLQRGSLVHRVQFKLLKALRDAEELPLTPARLSGALGRLDGVLDEVAAEYEDRLAPAIDRVWRDGIQSVRADLREWLRRASEAGDGWSPWRFELAFGLAAEGDDERDEASTPDPAALPNGIRLRGSIDLVERHTSGALRATDHKTGKVRATASVVVGGGETLQPVLYALALEQLFPTARIDSGRLYYCTATGDFTERNVPLDARARDAAALLAKTVGAALADGFLPAAPKKGGCDYCDYRPICGPYEELRASRIKRQQPLEALKALRALA